MSAPFLTGTIRWVFIFTTMAWLLANLAAAPLIAEDYTVAQLAAENAHRLYVLDAAYSHETASKIFVINGDTAEMIGMLDAGYLPNMVLPLDKTRLYVAETFWSRGTRGDRTDVVTLYDRTTLQPRAEAVLPRGRLLANPKKYASAVTSDGRYLITSNMDPATTASIVDTEPMKHIAEIETPGCVLVLPSGPRRFSMLCTDGSLLTIDFEADGNARTEESSPFFDPDQDPVFDHMAFVREKARAYFVTYGGILHRVDLSGTVPTFGEPWSLLSAADRSGKWRPGGWMPFAIHPASERLFVLMHRGGAWTHKAAGEEVWVFDLREKKRVERVRLEEPASSVALSLDDAPLLYTIADETQDLDIWDARTMHHKATLEELGDTPLLIYVPGE